MHHHKMWIPGTLLRAIRGPLSGPWWAVMQDPANELRRIRLPRKREEKGWVNNDALASIVGDANSVERGHQGMADDGSQQPKSDFRTAVEDGKALATVLGMKLESVLGRIMGLSAKQPAAGSLPEKNGGRTLWSFFRS